MSLAFAEYYLGNKILLFYLPPHATHHLQPLDIGVFSLYKHYYSIEVDSYT